MRSSSFWNLKVQYRILTYISDQKTLLYITLSVIFVGNGVSEEVNSPLGVGNL